jgi:hypothetical protein
MTASPPGPERRYRRLLWAYPGPYRRRHGTEIVTTLLELAESGSGRPSRAQALHLVACGIRQRFRLPARRPLAWVAAGLAAIALGGLGAAGGTWLGWRTATPVPTGAEMRTLTAAMAGSGSEVRVFPWQTAMSGPVVGSTSTGRGSYNADRIRAALSSAGWRVTTFTETTGRLVVDLSKDPHVEVPTRSVRFRATKDGLSLDGDSTTVVGGAGYGVDRRITQRMDIWAVDTGTVRPLTIAGLLVGMLAGWLLTAAVTGRTRHSDRAHRTAATVPGILTLAAAVVPALDFYRGLHQVLSYHSGSSPYIVHSPHGQLPTNLVLATTSIALLALAAAVLIATRGDRTGPDPTAGEPAPST